MFVINEFYFKTFTDIRKQHVVTDGVNLKLTALCFFTGNCHGCCTKLTWQSVAPYCGSSKVPFEFYFVSAEFSIHHCTDQRSLLQV